MKSKKGFTLIELLIVIAIIGILAAIIIIMITSGKEKAKVAQRQQFADGVRAQLSGAPVSWWKFEGSADDIWGSNNGSLQGGASIINAGGVTGGALDVRGVNGYVNAGNDSSLNITDVITVETWIKADSIVGWNSIVSKIDGNDNWNRGFNIFFTSGTINFYVTHYAANRASKTFTDTTEWHHVVGTYDGSDVKIFVDGKEGTPDPYIGSIDMSGTVDLRIGCSSSGGGSPNYFFDGLIDEVRVYREALTAQQIQRRYAESAPRYRMTLK